MSESCKPSCRFESYKALYLDEKAQSERAFHEMRRIRELAVRRVSAELETRANMSRRQISRRPLCMLLKYTGLRFVLRAFVRAARSIEGCL